MDQYRVSKDGVAVEIKTGTTTSPTSGNKVSNTRGVIASEGQVFSADQLADHIVEAWERGDEHVRSLMSKVPEEGAAPEAPSADDYAQLQQSVVDQSEQVDQLQQENQELRNQLEESAGALTQAKTEFDSIASGEAIRSRDDRISELENQVRELGGGPALLDGEGIDQLEGDDLKEAGKEAGHPKLDDRNWSDLSDDEKREALRRQQQQEGDQG